MGRLAGWLVATLGAALLVPAGSFAQTWNPPVPLGVDASTAVPTGVALGAGGYGVIYEDPSYGVIIHTAGGDGVDFDTQALGDRTGAFPTLAADAGGQAIAAWYQASDRSIRVSFGFSTGPFTAPVALAAGTTDGLSGAGQQSPLLAVSPLGWAVVVWLEDDAGGGARAYASVREPAGQFGPAVAIGPASDGAIELPASVAINDQGQTIVGCEENGVASAVVRSAGGSGTWEAPETIGGPWAGLTASDLEVGIDGSGGAVAVWDESGASPSPVVASLIGSFRPAGGSFGPPLGLIDTDTTEAPALGVSAAGEVILVARQVDPVSSLLLPISVTSGSTVLGRFGPTSPLAGTWEEFDPKVAINARGDAVVTTRSNDSAELIARRRAPFGPLSQAEEIVPPPYDPIYNSQGVTRQIAAVAVDQFGNAMVTWTDAAVGAPILVSLDGPLVTAVGAVENPDPLGLTVLVPPPAQTAGSEQPADPGAMPTAQAGTATQPPWPIPAQPAVPTDPHLRIVIEHAPPAVGSPRIVVAVHCATACRAGLRAVLSTPSKRRIVLPPAALALDAGGAVRSSLRLSPAALSALRTPAAKLAVRHRPRRFELTITATAGDAGGAPQTAIARLSFARR